MLPLLYLGPRLDRLLDRIVGYKISPLLWKTINKNASAGRVQSVALKLICDLEDEIKSFKPEIYWEVNAILENDIKVNLVEISEEKINKIKKRICSSFLNFHKNKDFELLQK